MTHRRASRGARKSATGEAVKRAAPANAVTASSIALTPNAGARDVAAQPADATPDVAAETRKKIADKANDYDNVRKAARLKVFVV